MFAFAGGKSAILTALCIAFGSRAKGTQRASTLKDFIKTGCRFMFLACLYLLLSVGRSKNDVSVWDVEESKIIIT